MMLVDITKDNWEKVIFLTTNTDNSNTICEEFVASNAYSILQSIYEDEWKIKAIEHEGELIGFAMYGFCEERNFYELCRFMIDRKHQGKGYGNQALSLIVEEIKNKYNCNEIYLSTDPENIKAKHLYEKFGFVSTGEIWDDEELYVLNL
ncbi:GNAT family N-acetyltransferase [Anaerocolumna aminovalerica]|uniref:GNAT family N-acetyltransferase n=1 Tax=Anaerocolumna aminovalerica TaxID=1527 RepID=UPI000BE3B0E0|nr:GNAT family N-acetyltransferase [Anaerocolumna aminovalerica]